MELLNSAQGILTQVSGDYLINEKASPTMQNGSEHIENGRLLTAGTLTKDIAWVPLLYAVHLNN